MHNCAFCACDTLIIRKKSSLACNFREIIPPNIDLQSKVDQSIECKALGMIVIKVPNINYGMLGDSEMQAFKTLGKRGHDCNG